MVTKRRRRPWFQFTLRTLLLGVVLVSVPLSCVSVRLKRTARLRAAERTIQRLGGQIKYPRPGLESLEWITWLLPGGAKVPSDPSIVILSQTQVRDADLRHLGALSRPIYLWLEDTQITDAGLEHVKGLKYLRYLDLTGTQVTPQGVAELQRALPKCRIFYAPSQ